MAQNSHSHDPLEFVRSMWNNMGFSVPGMVTPTLDVDELDKRIADLKAVEGWLKMNLNMLQMTTQGLEMQRAALAAVKAMSQHVQSQSESGNSGDGGNPFAAASTMWWNMMNQAAQSASAPAETASPASTSDTRSQAPRQS